jgi:hypothetical protein
MCSRLSLESAGSTPPYDRRSRQQKREFVEAGVSTHYGIPLSRVSAGIAPSFDSADNVSHPVPLSEVTITIGTGTMGGHHIEPVGNSSCPSNSERERADALFWEGGPPAPTGDGGNRGGAIPRAILCCNTHP